jgi:hypothetical protein
MCRKSTSLLQSYLHRIRTITQSAGSSEAKLQIGLEPILSEMLAEYQIPYDPVVNESLRAQGLSQASSLRPDSLFGHVLLDYKAPGTLRVTSQIPKTKEQIEGYLNDITGGHDQAPEECEKWAGILWDGYFLMFCHSDGSAWRWSRRYETSEASLLSLIQTYRSLHREPLTATLLSRYFGKDSETARAILPTMCSLLSKPKHRTSMLFREWRRLFEQVSTYTLPQIPSLREWAHRNGIPTQDASQILFALHTYYSIVVKLLTSELLAASQAIPESSLASDIANAPNNEFVSKRFAQLEDSDFYKRYRISNFLEGDFFSWYVDEASPQLTTGLVQIARTLQRFEPATAKLKPEAIKDLLKEFYSSLVDGQIRHDLGEYYTPDWLAQHVLNKVNYDGNPSEILVDPACGSGTFLVEAIAILRRKCEQREYASLDILRTVINCIRGLDLNPLAVVSARANYILAIADLVFELGDDIEIPVYLADAINVPVEKPGGILEYILDTEVEELRFEIPLKLVQNQVLGRILVKCEDDIGLGRPPEAFIAALRKMPNVQELLDQPTEERLKHFYSSIQNLNTRKPPWDSIWCRVVKNNFSPKGFGKVNYIVGNVPWVRWSRLPNSYRKRVKRFCDYYGLVSGKQYTGGIESDISTVLAFSAADHWLNPGGRIGLLITWTVFKSGSARGFRLGNLPDSSGIKIDGIDDLTAIQPFPDATNQTGIYFATKLKSARDAPFDEIPCSIWKPLGSSRIAPESSLSEVQTQVEIEEGEACPVSDFGSPLFTGRKAVFDSAKFLRGTSSYLGYAHRGTVTDLARVYWVKVEKYSPETKRALIRTLREDELSIARIVEPVEGVWIEADVLFPLLRGRNVGRYGIKTEGWYQIIPNRHYLNFENEDEFADKYPACHSYLINYVHLLTDRATYKRYLSGLPPYSIYCIGDYSFAPHKVVWPEQQNPDNFRASVVTSVGDEAIIPNRVIVPDHKLYFASLDNPEEAHYLCAFLNSRPVRSWLGGFLLSAQIGTTVFEFMHVPPFDPQHDEHQRLASLSVKAHLEREGTRNDHQLDLSEEDELEDLVKKIIASAQQKVGHVGAASQGRLF